MFRFSVLCISSEGVGGCTMFTVPYCKRKKEQIPLTFCTVNVERNRLACTHLKAQGHMFTVVCAYFDGLIKFLHST